MTAPADPTRPSLKIPRERLDEVRRLWMRGVPSLRIQRVLSTRWGVTTRTIRKYLKRVCDTLAKREEQTVEAHRIRAEEMLLETYRMARLRKGHTKDGVPYDDPDVKTMAVVAFRVAELHGAVVKKVEVTVDSHEVPQPGTPEYAALQREVLEGERQGTNASDTGDAGALN